MGRLQLKNLMAPFALVAVISTFGCEVPELTPETQDSSSDTPSKSIADALPVGSTAMGSCAIYQGQVKCWGSTLYTTLVDPGYRGPLENNGDDAGEMGVNLPAIDLGTNTFVTMLVESNSRDRCALFSDGRVKCWGLNTFGQLGLGDTVNRTDPSQMGDNLPYLDLGTGLTVASLSAGYRVQCALFTNGKVKCWGASTQAPYDPTDPTFVGDVAADMGDNLPFVALPAGRTAVAISSSSNVHCAILDDQSVYCWGTAGYLARGLLNFGGHGVKKISLGIIHACAILDDDSVRCWGANGGGVVGVGVSNAGQYLNDPSVLASVDLGVGRTAKEISSGGFHTCAILDNDQVKCWGMNTDGALGLEDGNARGENAADLGDNLPYVNLGTGRTVTELSAQASRTCAILDDSTVKCWGANYEGGLGLGDPNHRGAAAGTMGDALSPVLLW